MRYFQILNTETLEVFVSANLETQPENSLPFEVVEFVKPVFDQYPNPTKLVEGATAEDLHHAQAEKLNQKKQEQFEQLSKTDWYVVRFMETGVPIPQEIIEQRNKIRNL